MRPRYGTKPDNSLVGSPSPQTRRCPMVTHCVQGVAMRLILYLVCPICWSSTIPISSANGSFVSSSSASSDLAQMQSHGVTIALRKVDESAASTDALPRASEAGGGRPVTPRTAVPLQAADFGGTQDTLPIISAALDHGVPVRRMGRTAPRPRGR
jgi:hypothetical protein